MASRQDFVDTLVERMGAAGAVTAKKMFREYGIWCDGKLVALVCDDQLFLKPTEAGRALLGAPTEEPPYPGAKPSFLLSEAEWEDAERLSELVRATAAELPAPKPKKAKRPTERA
ncbi:MAG: TfoX/Sxy family protein [Methylobacteriaceae bacterium]|nr:TfoX/Sxy family protein [Methylobacteriaceae bacterium]